MGTRTGQVFHRRLTDIQRNYCIKDSYAQVEALQNTVDELSKATSNLTGESSSPSVPQPQHRELDNIPHESVQEFLQRPFDARDAEDIPQGPRQDDLSKKIKLEVADFSGQGDARAFLDWLTSFEDHFTWYHGLKNRTSQSRHRLGHDLVAFM